MKKQYMIPILLSNTKEKSDSIFSSEVEEKKNTTEKNVVSTIEKYVKNLKGKEVEKQLYFLGGCFSDLPKQKMQELLNAAYEEMEKGTIDSIAITTKANNLDKETLKMLKKYRVKTIELVVLSSNDYVLAKAGMDYTFEEVKQAAKKIRWYGFELGCQIMVGLPESTKIDELNTAKECIKLKPQIVRIAPVIVEKGTKLEKDFEQEIFEPISLVQAVERSKELIYLFSRKRIHNIHLEMQPGKNLKQEDIIAGPFHTEFALLVESDIWYDSIVDQIKRYNVKVKEVEVVVNPADINAVIGYEKENLKRLDDTYDVDLKVVMNNKVKQGKSEMNIIQTFTDFKEEQEKINK